MTTVGELTTLFSCCCKPNKDEEDNINIKTTLMCCVKTDNLHLDIQDGAAEEEEERGGDPSQDILLLRKRGSTQQLNSNSAETSARKSSES